MTFLTSTSLFSPFFSGGKKLCCALLLTVLVIATLLGQDANDYKFSTSIRPFSLLTGGTTLPNLPNQTVLGSAVNIGFNFYFSNQAYSKLKIAKDGYVTFSEEATISSNINSNGFQVLDAPMLAPLWDNLSGSNGVASYATLGNSPNRIFVVEWKNWGWARLDNRYFTVQALLYEGSNKIELHYSGSQISSVQSATIGISSRDAFSSLKSLNVYHTAWGEWLTTEYNNVNNVSFYPNEGQVFTFTPPTCTPPKNLKIEGITDNRATVRWNKPLAGIPTNYTWALKSYPGDIVPLSSGTTADSVVLLNNLTPLSNYWVSVYATCQNLDLSLVTSRNFYTEREPDVRVPYFEGFELDSSRLPDYWSSNDWKVGSANYEPAVAGEGRNIAYYSGNNARAILTTPSIASIGQTPRLSYKYWIGDRPDNRRDVGVQPLEIYISNANSSELSKIWAHDYHNSIFSSSRDSGWQTQTIDLVGYESSLFKIHFRASIMDWNGQLSTIAVDSVRLNNAPNCVAPINLTAQVFSGDSILIGWEAKDGQNKWEIQYGAKGFRLGQGNRIVANSHPFMVRNLQLNTEYEFYVRSLCSASETSQWSPVSVSAKTLCGGIITDFPYFEGFDSLTLNPCWRIETTKNTFGWQVSYDSLLNNNILPADGRGYMGMKDQNANGLIASLYSPAISLGSEPKRLVYKYFTTPPYSPFAVEISLNQTKWDTLFEHTERNTFNAGGGSFDSWYYRVIDLSNYKNKTIFIRFKFRKTYVNLQPDNHTFLDNFTIENSNNTCQTPTDLSSTGLKDDNSIELAWSKGTNETKWEIEYGDKLFKLGTGIRVQISERPRYILRGEQLSDKEFYVRGVCGTNAFTRWVGPLRCLNPRPALYAISLYPDASPQMEGNKIDWKFLSFIRTSPISANNQQGVPASHLNNQWRTETELAFTNLGQLSWIVSPRIHNLRQGTHRLNFRINIYSDRSFPIQLTVGTMSSRKDTNSFIPSVQYPISDTIMTANNARGTFIRKTIDFTNTPEGNDFIAFRYYCPNDDSNAGQNRVAFAVDSIELERVPTCSTPINVKIDAAKITYKGATVKWQRGTIPNNTASGFNWRVTEKDKSPFVKNPVIAGTTSADSVRFEGLEPRTVYDFYVQSFCSDPNDTCTYWTKATRFRTAAVNDDCSNATTLTVFEDALSVTRNDYKYFINGNHQSDIRTTDITCPTSNQPIQDIWYVINTPNSSSRVVLKTFSDLLSGTTIDWVMAVYKGSCDNLTYVGCSDNYLTPPNNFDYTMPTYFLTNYEPNAKYYIRLYNKVNYDFQREYLLPIDSAKIIVYCEQSACPNPPINDKCANAINLVSGYTEGVNNKYATRDANSNSDVVCEPNVNIKDIWYKFHTDTGSFRTFRMALNIRNNGTGSLKYAIYKGSCNNLYRMSDCKSIVINTQKTDTFDLLEANQDYFICVWSHSDSTTAASNSTIRIDKLRNFDAIPLGNATTTNLCQPFKSVEINLSNSNKWVSLVDNTGIVGEINANGNLLGQVTGSYYINSTGTIRRATSVPYLDRNIGIKVTNQPTRDVSIRLYFTEAELAAYYDVVGTNPVAITHYAGALCSPTALSIVGDVLPATIGRTANRNNYVQFNTQRFSGFLVGPYTALVPVELKSFSASAQEKGNLLQWVTASEKGNAHFILERSGSGLDFESIATIKGKGSSVTQSNYQFEDTNPLPVSYYRLKQIDVNGNSAYSKTISVIHEKNTLQPRFYPSIAKDFITIELFNNSQTEVSITNLTGKMVLNQPNITNTSQLNISHLTAGFYIVSIRQAGVHISGRLVKN